MTVPPLAERQRLGLSQTLTGPKHPNACQSCGALEQTDLLGVPETAPVTHLTRWRECDEWDKPTLTIVVLCRRCSDRLIEKHARMYIPLELFRPFPGVMELCVDCIHRNGTSCQAPAAKHNGGRGLKITSPSRPSRTCERLEVGAGS